MASGISQAPLQVTELSTACPGAANAVSGVYAICPAPGLDAVLAAVMLRDVGERIMLLPLDGSGPIQVVELPDGREGRQHEIGGLCASSSGRVYVADKANQEVLSFQLRAGRDGRMVAASVHTIEMDISNLQVSR
jgi:hypothetical protein